MKHLYIAHILCLINIVNIYAETEKIILCTYHTESHKQLVHEWMVPSIKDNFEIIIGTGEQVCPDATFYAQGWTQTTLDKAAFIADVVEHHQGRIIIFADADIIFLKPIESLIRQALETKEFVVQQDAPDKTLCSGFFALRANEKTTLLWHSIVAFMQKHPIICDQGALNYYIQRRTNRLNINWAFLLTDYFCGGGTFKKRLWKPGKKALIPKTVCMFHANYASYHHKIAYLEYVRTMITGV